MDSNSGKPLDVRREKFALWRTYIFGSISVIRSSLQEWNGKKKHLYREEKMILQKHTISLYAGVFTTFFLFAARRLGRSNWYNKFRMEQLADSVGLSSTSVKATSKANVNKTSPKPIKTSPPIDRRKQIETLKLEETRTQFMQKMETPIDLMACSFTGCVLFFVLQSPHDFTNDVLGLPLVAGRSLVHQYACEDLEKVYIDGSYDLLFDQNISQDDEEVLRWYQRMVRNCQLRSDHIESRYQAGIKHPEIIPYPGIQSPDIQQ